MNRRKKPEPTPVMTRLYGDPLKKRSTLQMYCDRWLDSINLGKKQAREESSKGWKKKGEK